MFEENYMGNGYRVVTTTQADGKIVQVVETVVDRVIEHVLEQVLDTQEKQTRQALIALGWTPPVEAS